jgi:hypothetical protein
MASGTDRRRNSALRLVMRFIPQPLLLAILPFAFATAAFAQAETPPETNTLSEQNAAAPDFTALTELFPEGIPTLLTPQSVATAYRLPPSVQPPDAEKKLPTRIEYADGPLKWDLGTNVTTRKTTTTIVPVIPDPYIVGGAAGGGGEVKGHVRYVGEDWEFYGAQSVGTYQGDGTAPTLSETTTFGSLYKLPDWTAGAKIGASLELNSADQRKTRIEYRQPLGGAEGFIAAEQTFVPADTEHRPSPSVRAGINRKF